MPGEELELTMFVWKDLQEELANCWIL